MHIGMRFVWPAVLALQAFALGAAPRSSRSYGPHSQARRFPDTVGSQ